MSRTAHIKVPLNLQEKCYSKSKNVFYFSFTPSYRFVKPINASVLMQTSGLTSTHAC